VVGEHGPNIIDATVLPADEVERRRRQDVEVYGNAFVLKPQPEFPQWCLRALRSIGTPIFELDDGRQAVCVASRPLRAGDDEHVRRMLACMHLRGMKHVVSVSTAPPEGLCAARFCQFDDGKLYGGGHVDQIILDDPPATDALALTARPADSGPDATQGVLTPAKLTPAEARVARKLAGPWPNERPWQHRKKGGRR
jgi:hypothetical protein